MRTRSMGRKGFTLVELMTVIVIIAILAGLTAGAVNNAIKQARIAAIRAEIGQLEMALSAYYGKYGEYPPDGTDATKVKNHINQCYRNFNGNVPTVTPETALKIFLGPLNVNPRDPFNVTDNTSTTKPFFEFDRNRLDNNNRYSPSGSTQPYVYFRAEFVKGKGNYDGKQGTVTDGNNNRAKPYADANSKWYQESTFQIVTAGLDNDYGSGNAVVNDNLGAAHLDNIVNFAKGRLKDLLD
ncbi:MAG: prepilin-type N-terminal cleavage/methylation domain-containing protein [Planctomycetia bacterium]|nr:prepilin-type N-terminal cleavage/methylation domain-containing protein [Planctomycetia bacterium]